MGLATKVCHWFFIGLVLVLSSKSQASQDDAGSKKFHLERIDTVMVPLRSETSDSNRTTERILSPVRKRRYVRFPSGPGGYVYETSGTAIGPRNVGTYPAARFGPQPQFSSPWRQYKSLWRSPVSEYSRPVMGHRTPRLIFRDNDFLPPASGGTTTFFQSNQLPDFEDDVRGKTTFYIVLIINWFFLYFP